MLIDLPTLIKNIDVEIRCATAQQAAQEIAQNGGLVVDVREPSEVECHPVDAAVNIPRGIIEMKMLERVSDPHEPIYLHCASGVRAQLAAEQLIKVGYENVTVITCPVPVINQVNAQ